MGGPSMENGASLDALSSLKYLASAPVPVDLGSRACSSSSPGTSSVWRIDKSVMGWFPQSTLSLLSDIESGTCDATGLLDTSVDTASYQPYAIHHTVAPWFDQPMLFDLEELNLAFTVSLRELLDVLKPQAVHLVGSGASRWLGEEFFEMATPGIDLPVEMRRSLQQPPNDMDLKLIYPDVSETVLEELRTRVMDFFASQIGSQVEMLLRDQASRDKVLAFLSAQYPRVPESALSENPLPYLVKVMCVGKDSLIFTDTTVLHVLELKTNARPQHSSCPFSDCGKVLPLELVLHSHGGVRRTKDFAIDLTAVWHDPLGGQLRFVHSPEELVTGIRDFAHGIQRVVNLDAANEATFLRHIDGVTAGEISLDAKEKKDLLDCVRGYLQYVYDPNGAWLRRVEQHLGTHTKSSPDSVVYYLFNLSQMLHSEGLVEIAESLWTSAPKHLEEAIPLLEQRSVPGVLADALRTEHVPLPVVEATFQLLGFVALCLHSDSPERVPHVRLNIGPGRKPFLMIAGGQRGDWLRLELNPGKALSVIQKYHSECHPDQWQHWDQSVRALSSLLVPSMRGETPLSGGVIELLREQSIDLRDVASASGMLAKLGGEQGFYLGHLVYWLCGQVLPIDQLSEEMILSIPKVITEDDEVMDAVVHRGFMERKHAIIALPDCGRRSTTTSSSSAAAQACSSIDPNDQWLLHLAGSGDESLCALALHCWKGRGAPADLGVHLLSQILPHSLPRAVNLAGQLMANGALGPERKLRAMERLITVMKRSRTSEEDVGLLLDVANMVVEPLRECSVAGSKGRADLWAWLARRLIVRDQQLLALGILTILEEGKIVNFHDRNIEAVQETLWGHFSEVKLTDKWKTLGFSFENLRCLAGSVEEGHLSRRQFLCAKACEVLRNHLGERTLPETDILQTLMALLDNDSKKALYPALICSLYAAEHSRSGQQLLISLLSMLPSDEHFAVLELVLDRATIKDALPVLSLPLVIRAIKDAGDAGDTLIASLFAKAMEAEDQNLVCQFLDVWFQHRVVQPQLLQAIESASSAGSTWLKNHWSSIREYVREIPDPSQRLAWIEKMLESDASALDDVEWVTESLCEGMDHVATRQRSIQLAAETIEAHASWNRNPALGPLFLRMAQIFLSQEDAASAKEYLDYYTRLPGYESLPSESWDLLVRSLETSLVDPKNMDGRTLTRLLKDVDDADLLARVVQIAEQYSIALPPQQRCSVLLSLLDSEGYVPSDALRPYVEETVRSRISLHRAVKLLEGYSIADLETWRLVKDRLDRRSHPELRRQFADVAFGVGTPEIIGILCDLALWQPVSFGMYVLSHPERFKDNLREAFTLIGSVASDLMVSKSRRAKDDIRHLQSLTASFESLYPDYIGYGAATLIMEILSASDQNLINLMTRVARMLNAVTQSGSPDTDAIMGVLVTFVLSRIERCKNMRCGLAFTILPQLEMFLMKCPLMFGHFSLLMDVLDGAVGPRIDILRSLAFNKVWESCSADMTQAQEGEYFRRLQLLCEVAKSPSAKRGYLTLIGQLRSTTERGSRHWDRFTYLLIHPLCRGIARSLDPRALAAFQHQLEQEVLQCNIERDEDMCEKVACALSLLSVRTEGLHDPFAGVRSLIPKAPPPEAVAHDPHVITKRMLLVSNWCSSLLGLSPIYPHQLPAVFAEVHEQLKALFAVLRVRRFSKAQKGAIYTMISDLLTLSALQAPGCNLSAYLPYWKEQLGGQWKDVCQTHDLIAQVINPAAVARVDLTHENLEDAIHVCANARNTKAMDTVCRLLERHHAFVLQDSSKPKPLVESAEIILKVCKRNPELLLEIDRFLPLVVKLLQSKNTKAQDAGGVLGQYILFALASSPANLLACDLAGGKTAVNPAKIVAPKLVNTIKALTNAFGQSMVYNVLQKTIAHTGEEILRLFPHNPKRIVQATTRCITSMQSAALGFGYTTHSYRAFALAVFLQTYSRNPYPGLGEEMKSLFNQCVKGNTWLAKNPEKFKALMGYFTALNNVSSRIITATSLLPETMDPEDIVVPPQSPASSSSSSLASSSSAGAFPEDGASSSDSTPEDLGALVHVANMLRFMNP